MSYEREIACAKESTRFLPRLGTGGTFLDLGANIGEVSIQAAKYFDRVIAVEAHPDTAKIAAARIKAAKLSDKITLLRQAVAVDGGISMWVSSPARSTSSTVRLSKRLVDPPKGYYKEVRTVAFRSLIQCYNPRAVKMDIEGMEYECLLQYQVVPTFEHLVVEFHGTFGADKRRLAFECGALLNRYGFSLLHPKRIRSHPAGGLKGHNLVAHFARLPKPHFSFEDILDA